MSSKDKILNLLHVSTNRIISANKKIYQSIYQFSKPPFTFKKLLFSITILSAIVVICFAYLSRITIYQPHEIWLTKNDSILNVEFEIKAIKPILGDENLPYDSISKTWKIDKGYFYKLIFRHKAFNTNDKSQISLNILNKANGQKQLINFYRSENFSTEYFDSKSNLDYVKFKAVIWTTIRSYFSVFLFIFIFLIVVLFKRLRKLSIINYFSITIIILFGLFWLILASLFCYPNAEDLSLVVVSKKAGIINGAIQFLATYDGRYFTNILHGLSPLSWSSVDSYKYIILFSLFLTFFAHMFFLKISGILKNYWHITFAITSLLIISHFAMIPSIVNELYWMASSFVYLWAWNFFIIWIGLIILFLRATNNFKKTILFILSITTLALSYGINEMMIILNLYALAAILYHEYKKCKDNLIHLIPFMITSIVCIYVFVSSPGIYHRMESTGITRDLPFYTNVISKGLSDITKILFEWTFTNAVTIPLVLINTVLFLKYSKNKISSNFLTIILIGLTLLIFILPFTFYIPMGVEKYPDRIFNFTNWIYLIAILFIIPLLITNFINKKPFLQKIPANVVLSFSALLLLYGISFGDNNYNKIRKEYYSGEYMKYKTEMEHRYKIISDAITINNWKSATIDSLHSNAKTIYSPPEILPNRTESNWNIAYESFFNIDEIKFASDTINKKTIIENHVKKIIPNN